MDLTMSTMRRGEVLCYDARNAGSAPLWRLEAHGKECSVLAMNAAVPGLMLTGSTDKTLKVTRHFQAFDLRGILREACRVWKRICCCPTCANLF